MRLVLVALLVLLVGAVAPEPRDEAEATLHAELDIESYHSVPVGSDATETCGTDGSLEVVDGWLQFEDGADEQGCIEAVYTLELPDTLDEMRLRFVANREVSAIPGTAPYFIQSFSMRHEGTLVSCIGKIDVFGPRSGSQADTPFDRNYDLTGCTRIAGEQVELVFTFMDVAASKDEGGVIHPETIGQSTAGAVTDIQLDFMGGAVPVVWETKSGASANTDAIGFLQATILVPERPPTYQQAVTVELSNRHAIIGLFYIGDDGPDEVPETMLEASESGGILRLTLSSAVLQEYGPGEYHALFTDSRTGFVAPERIPAAALALLAPLVAGLVAQRNINQLHRSAHDRHPEMRRGLQILVLVAWAMYMLVALFMMFADVGIGMVAWPLPPANLATYGALIVATVAMVGVAIYAKRNEINMVVNDLSEVERIRNELERSNRDLEQFAYVASHDLKEPLRMVAGYTQLLEMRLGKELDDDAKECLDYAGEGAQRLQAMVDDLLAYSKVRTAPRKQVPVALDDVLSVVRSQLKATIDERGARIEAEPLPVVVGDRTQLLQLMQNLVHNAIKFNPQDKPLVRITGETAAGMAAVSVHDEGIGINPHQQDRVFNIFQRLNLREEYEGNGIGLAVCKQIVELSGGELSVRSRPGKGSTFTFTLPTEASKHGT